MKTVYKKPACIGEFKANAYCPGCMHSTVVRLVAEVLEELGIVDDTVLFAGVGCDANGSFGYLDVDTIISAHGRACAIASAYKRCNPDNVAFTYQGDGDLAAIGFSESMHAANRGENITVIFVNNAQYGMTGGQMAPTTLIGQKTTSSPAGRSKERQGEPLDVTKLYTGMDIAYLARGSLDSVANINKTKSYLRKAFEKQMNHEGFSLVEILSPCPTNWGLSPHDAMMRIRNEVQKVYPIGEYIERGVK